MKSHGRHHGWALHDELLTGAIFRSVYQAPTIQLMPRSLLFSRGPKEGPIAWKPIPPVGGELSVRECFDEAVRRYNEAHEIQVRFPEEYLPHDPAHVLSDPARPGAGVAPPG